MDTEKTMMIQVQVHKIQYILFLLKPLLFSGFSYFEIKICFSIFNKPSTEKRHRFTTYEQSLKDFLEN